MDKRIVIHKSKKKAILILATGLLLAAGGWAFIHYMYKNVIGWSLIIAAAVCFLTGIGILTDRKPYIILTRNGITELSVLKVEIEWNAIRQVNQYYYRGLYFICLLVSRNYKPDSLRPAWFNRLDPIYEKEGVKALFIKMGFLEVSSNQLARFIYEMVHADSKKREELLNTPLTGKFPRNAEQNVH